MHFPAILSMQRLKNVLPFSTHHGGLWVLVKKVFTFAKAYHFSSSSPENQIELLTSLDQKPYYRTSDYQKKKIAAALVFKNKLISYLMVITSVVTISEHSRPSKKPWYCQSALIVTCIETNLVHRFCTLFVRRTDISFKSASCNQLYNSFLFEITNTISTRLGFVQKQKCLEVYPLPCTFKQLPHFETTFAQLWKKHWPTLK